MVQVKVVNKSKNELPAYQTPGAAGLDVCAHLEAPFNLAPGERWLIPTGLYFEIPEGYEIQVRPRSGLALKSGITLVNTPGTIDSDYRGELGILLINHSHESFVVMPGMRIAQLVLAPVVRLMWDQVDELASSTRAEGGFGHTGTGS
jgi:dUTP pyrophosphatase